MFKVLYAPFDDAHRMPAGAHSALVWESDKGVRFFSGNIASDPEGRKSVDERFEVAAEFLNSCRSFQDVKEMIISIYYTNEMGARIRRTEAVSRRRFFPSFSGHGGHGADAWD